MLEKPGQGYCRQAKVIGQEYEVATMLEVVEMPAPQFVGICFGGIKGLQTDDLIAAQAAGAVDGVRMQPAVTKRFLCPHDKPGARLLDGIKPAPVYIGAVHKINRTRFPQQSIEPKHFLIGAQTDQYLGG